MSGLNRYHSDNHLYVPYDRFIISFNFYATFKQSIYDLLNKVWLNILL